jgi:MYXO-CTERM domain-containing protein
MVGLLSALVQPAFACGGFFCNNVPVDQGGEDILFGVDEDKGEVTVHVKIDYVGDAPDFAWIVPVPQVPEILLSSRRVFDELAYRTATVWNLSSEEVYSCTNDYYYGGYAEDGATYSSSTFADTGAPGVQVISTSEVGPYDTVTLQANDSQALLTWLGDNGYQLPDDLDPVLQPYITDGAYFVALKLQKDASVGSLQPIALRYPGTGASIPIQLTSIAATPDMRLHVYVLGQHRAVPDSYLHVKVNDIVVDWFSYGSNYEDAITVAADEAGGHAFATDYSGDGSALMKDVLWQPGRYDTAALAASPDAYTFFNELLYQGFYGDSQMLALFEEFLPMPAALAAQGVDEQSFYNCLSCYSEHVDQIPFDAPAFAAAIDERIVTPLHDAQTMFDAMPHLTRMTSSVSPVEMTVDPTFVFNADMEQDVSNVHTARLDYLCGFGGDMGSSQRHLVLADGRTYDLPSLDSFRNAGITEYEYLQDLMSNYAIVIERTSGSGQPEVLVDHTQDEFAKAQAFNDALGFLGDGNGCGCQSTAGGSAAVGALAALGLIVRRRRS